MAGRVTGKVALITGAARGQGRAHAVRLAQEGADIVAIDLCAPLPDVGYPSATAEDLAETVRQVEALDRRIVSAAVDVRDLAGLRAIADRGAAELGRLDVLVANAGICAPAPWDSVTPEMLANHLDINVTGAWNTVMAGAPHLIKAGGGSIVLTSSAAGLKPQPFLVHYTTSKWAVRGMAKAFAVELGKHNIRVNSLHPGAVDTPMSGPAADGGADMGEVLGKAFAEDARLVAMFNNLLPVEKSAPEDLANAVLFLASDESRFVTAHEMAVDAGSSEF